MDGCFVILAIKDDRTSFRRGVRRECFTGN
jgi:hypothetical protein